MRPFLKKGCWLIAFIIAAVPLAWGATITGTVKGPDGAPFMGAFVRARNTATNISTDVLSHEDGHYMVPNLPAGDYVLTIRAPGYKAAPQRQTLQTADQHVKCDFALQKGMVTWADITGWQGRQLFPPGPGREIVTGTCFACHQWQHRMIPHRGLNKQGWLSLVNFMRHVAIPRFLPPSRFTDPMADQAATYLTQVFGPNSDLPSSPADLPGYQATVRKFSPEAMNIVYVVYPVAGKWVNDKWVPNPLVMTAQMFPPTAGMGYPSNGSIWVSDVGSANEVHRVNPTTGKVTNYPIPTTGKNLKPCVGLAVAEEVHAIEVGPDGKAWFAEAGCHRVGSLDPETGKITQYQDGGKHDSHPMLVDGKLYIFSSGSTDRLDPATGKFTPITGFPRSYGVIEDKKYGVLFFTQPSFGPNSKGTLAEVNPKTLKVTTYAPSNVPAGFNTHRTAIDSHGNLWLTCYSRRGSGGNLSGSLSTKVCRFDPKTKAFKVYTPLGPDTSDYAIGVGKGDYVWYSMVELGTIQRLNPGTGRILEYPVPFTEQKTLRYWPDAEGRLWTVSQGYNSVFYFYLKNSKH